MFLLRSWPLGRMLANHIIEPSLMQTPFGLLGGLTFRSLAVSISEWPEYGCGYIQGSQLEGKFQIKKADKKKRRKAIYFSD